MFVIIDKDGIMINVGVNVKCDKVFIWNPSNCECQSDKSCDTGKYLDYENCKCRKKQVHKLVEKCNEEIDRNEMIYNDYGNVCNSCTTCIMLFALVVHVFIFIGT